MHAAFIIRPAYATDGVGATPQEYATLPDPKMPEITRWERSGLVVLVSIPTRISDDRAASADPVFNAILRSS
jgi:hypothetical protein